MAGAAALVRRLRHRRRTEQVRAAQDLSGLAYGGTPEDRDRLVAASAIPALLSMLSSGSPALQEAAALALADLAAGDGRRVRAASAEVAIPVLVSMLSYGRLDAAVVATGALSNMECGSHATCAAILAAGAAAPLLRLAGSEDAPARAVACTALVNLSHDLRSHAALMEAGAFPALVSVPQRAAGGSGGSGSSDDRVDTAAAARCAAQAMDNLLLLDRPGPDESRLASPEAAAAAAAAGAPSALVRLLRRCSDEGSLQAAAETLGCLTCSSHPGVYRAIDAAGGLAALAERLCCSSSSARTLTGVLRALTDLVADQPERSFALAAMPGALPRLVQLLGSAAGSARVQSEAAAALANIALYKHIAGAAVATGVVPALAAALRAAGCAPAPAPEIPHLASNLAAAGQGEALLAAGLATHLHQLAASSVPGVSKYASKILELMGNPLNQPAPAVRAASVLQQQPRPACAAPGCSATSGLRLCGGCGTVNYCSAACSRAHWRHTAPSAAAGRRSRRRRQQLQLAPALI